MTAPDPRTPVIAGAGQSGDRSRADASPLGLMTEAAQRAFADCGDASAASALLAKVGQVSVAHVISWPVGDPARLLAGELGIEGAETVRSAIGGVAPLHLLAHACDRIADGEIDVAVIAGAEAVRPLVRAMSEGRDPGWPAQPEDTVPDRFVGDDRNASHPAEVAAGLIAPVNYYPWFEHALRASAGRDRETQRELLGQLWHRFAAVAAGNEHAWSRDSPAAREIAEPSADNRMISDPYTKLLTANIQVDQGSALVLCSLAAADAAGIPAERRSFVRSVAAANDRWFAAERERLDRSPAIAACGREVLVHADLAIDEVEHLDLYSCFPSAVQIAAAELGIDLTGDERAPTVTGGLTFAGGPGNDYCGHSLAAMHHRLREHGGCGLVTGVGWYMSKHAAAVLSADPPPVPFEAFNPQAEVDALPGREVASEPGGVAPVEAYTVAYDRGGEPERATISAILADGSRALAASTDPATIARLTDADPLGAEAEFGDGSFAL